MAITHTAASVGRDRRSHLRILSVASCLLTSPPPLLFSSPDAPGSFNVTLMLARDYQHKWMTDHLVLPLNVISLHNDCIQLLSNSCLSSPLNYLWLLWILSSFLHTQSNSVFKKPSWLKQLASKWLRCVVWGERDLHRPSLKPILPVLLRDRLHTCG